MISTQFREILKNYLPLILIRMILEWHGDCSKNKYPVLGFISQSICMQGKDLLRSVRYRHWDQVFQKLMPGNWQYGRLLHFCIFMDFKPRRGSLHCRTSPGNFWTGGNTFYPFPTWQPCPKPCTWSRTNI